METLRRIVYLIFRPTAEWDLIATEKTSVDLLLRRYILPLSLGAPVATVIGMNTSIATGIRSTGISCRRSRSWRRA
jgi:hypothetical protein